MPYTPPYPKNQLCRSTFLVEIKKHILTVIVLSQFCCTSLWFAGNAVMNDLVSNFELDQHALGHLTSGVQFGFITGTLLFAILTIADRFSPSRVFFVCAMLGALFNVGLIGQNNGFFSLIMLRFFTGFFLAGIYPFGMKIAADYYEKGLGKSLGFLVGALVLGTAFPHFLKGFSGMVPWHFMILGTSVLAVLGGCLMYIFVPDGPFRKSSQKLNPSALFNVFKNRDFRSAAFGYFGHMWELYAFWAFIPVLLSTYQSLHHEESMNIPAITFFIMATGGAACVMGGYVSVRIGTKKTAFTALLLSCLCCILSPFIFYTRSPQIFIAFLLFWGMMVVADSPLFSTLVAQNTQADTKGTALTIVNCLGFSITILSIQLLTYLMTSIHPRYLFTILALGPMFGLMALAKK